jgi:hypothetical protein
MAIRDMDIAAELIGIQPLPMKLMAFAISSYYAGVAGALFVFTYLGSAEVEVFDINISFEILFMVIIGGLGSVSGAFFGAAFIVLIPILITNLPLILGIPINAATVEHFNFMILGALIVLFLIFEPHGLAKIWSIVREKIKNKTISAPKIIKLKCSTVAALIGIPNINGRFVIKIGIRTMKAAPKNAPETLPSPPMITMNNISKEMLISKTSTSAEPR